MKQLPKHPIYPTERLVAVSGFCFFGVDAGLNVELRVHFHFDHLRWRILGLRHLTKKVWNIHSDQLKAPIIECYSMFCCQCFLGILKSAITTIKLIETVMINSLLLLVYHQWGQIWHHGVDFKMYCHRWLPVSVIIEDLSVTFKV